MSKGCSLVGNLPVGSVDGAVALNTDNATGDAFGRVRVSNPATIYAQKFLYGKSEGTFFNEELNGGATSVHDFDHACIDMSVSSNGDYVIRQSKQRFNYQAGKSQFVLTTGIINPTENVTQRIGYFQGGTSSPFDVIDGLCFEADGTTMSVCIYKGGLKNREASQGNWNIDNLDGNGPSKLIIDWSKPQIFVIDFQWLGLGRVRYGIDLDGVLYYIHEFNNANFVDQVYMRSPNQPIRYEIRSNGGSATMKQICISVNSEGGQDPAGLIASIQMDSNVSLTTSWQMLKAVRLKSTELDATVDVLSKSTIAVSSGDYQWALLWNPIITNPTWIDVQGASIQESTGDGSANYAITPTLFIDTGYNSSDTDAITAAVDSTLKLGSDIDGGQDVIALAVRTLSGSENFRGSLTLRQLT